jgi:hypothetical protein
MIYSDFEPHAIKKCVFWLYRYGRLAHKSGRSFVRELNRLFFREQGLYQNKTKIDCRLEYKFCSD